MSFKFMRANTYQKFLSLVSFLLLFFMLVQSLLESINRGYQSVIRNAFRLHRSAVRAVK